MDGKKQWRWVLPLFLLMLPKIIWNKICPPPKSPMQAHYDRSTAVAEHQEDVRKTWESKQQEDK